MCSNSLCFCQLYHHNVNIGFLSLSCHNAVTHTKNSPSSAILHNIKSDITVLHICKGTFPHMYTYLWAQIAVFISASFSFIFYPVTSTICHLFTSISCIWKLLCLHIVLLYSHILYCFPSFSSLLQLCIILSISHYLLNQIFSFISSLFFVSAISLLCLLHDDHHEFHNFNSTVLSLKYHNFLRAHNSHSLAPQLYASSFPE